MKERMALKNQILQMGLYSEYNHSFYSLNKKYVFLAICHTFLLPNEFLASIFNFIFLTLFIHSARSISGKNTWKMSKK